MRVKKNQREKFVVNNVCDLFQMDWHSSDFLSSLLSSFLSPPKRHLASFPSFLSCVRSTNLSFFLKLSSFLSSGSSSPSSSLFSISFSFFLLLFLFSSLILCFTFSSFLLFLILSLTFPSFLSFSFPFFQKDLKFRRLLVIFYPIKQVETLGRLILARTMIVIIQFSSSWVVTFILSTILFNQCIYLPFFFPFQVSEYLSLSFSLFHNFSLHSFPQERGHPSAIFLGEKSSKYSSHCFK